MLMVSASIGHLDAVPISRSACVRRITGDGPLRRRLMEMGLCPGTLVEVLRRAPLGDPIELRLRGYLLSVRGEHARLVEVELLERSGTTGP